MIGIVRKIKSNRKLKVRNFYLFSIPLWGRGRDFRKKYLLRYGGRKSKRNPTLEQE